MNETNKKTCQFESEWDPVYECPEPALRSSEKGYCIFHEPKEDKDIERFNEGIKRKLHNKDYNFRGYWFPVAISLFELLTFEESEERVCFGESTFKGRAHFGGSTFKGKADFGGSTFEGRADFGESTFEEWACFGESTFEEWASFGRSFFKRGAEFGGSTFKKVIYLDDVIFKIPSGADILFRRAKALWHQAGNYVEEGKCHYQEMDYLRKQKKCFNRYILDNFNRILHGYGEKPRRVLGWALGMIIGFALVFMHFGIGQTGLFVTKLPNLPNYSIFQFSTLKTIGSVVAHFVITGKSIVPIEDWANIGRYFYFSAVTFTTLGYGDFRPTHPVSHLISCAEAFIGMFMMALFVLVSARKWRR